MNIKLQENEESKKIYIIIYGTIILVCVICLVLAFYAQFYARIDIGKLIGINKEVRFGEKTEEQKNEIEANFFKIFNNKIENSEGDYNSKKDDSANELVYTKYEKKESKTNSYDLEIHIPHINIKNEIIDKYNKEIEKIFVNMADKILKSENKNIIYTVEYAASVQDGILSVIIHSNFKDGANAQRVIIKTYNYDLRNNKEITLQEILKFEQLEEKDIQNQINFEIKTEQQRVKDLEEVGYKIYSRDIDNDIYKIENTTEFYITKNVLYIVYAYGNESQTSEMDLIII